MNMVDVIGEVVFFLGLLYLFESYAERRWRGKNDIGIFFLYNLFIQEVKLFFLKD